MLLLLIKLEKLQISVLIFVQARLIKVVKRVTNLKMDITEAREVIKYLQMKGMTPKEILKDIV